MTRHFREKLSDFVDQQLSTEDKRAVGEHLLVCDQCRREHDEIRLGAAFAGRLEQLDAPLAVWQRIENELDGGVPHVTIIPDANPFRFRMLAALGAAVVVVALFAGLAYRGLFTAPAEVVVNVPAKDVSAQNPATDPVTAPPQTGKEEPSISSVPAETNANSLPSTPNAAIPGHEPPTAWDVETLAGRPQVASADGKLAVGSYLITDGSSKARVEVADIGIVDVQPNSRLKLVGTNSEQHRLSLERGKLHARIAAPPRLFIVDTPSAVAVDLGCEYTLEVDNAGNNRLYVTSGFVALERAGRESIVPAGAMCLTRKGVGLGTPFSPDSSERFQAALERFDFARGGSAAVDELLASQGPYDIISLWHLLSRVSRADRARVFEALAKYVAPPTGVTRDGVARLNKKMLDAWRDEVERVWFE